MKIALSIIPSWTVIYAPYNLAILNSVLKNNNHESKIFDLNVILYNKLKNYDIELWETVNEFHWKEKIPFNKIYRLIEKYIDEYIDDLIDYNPDCIGFTVFESNINVTKKVIEKIKKRNPLIKIILGGPECRHIIPDDLIFDSMVIGEGEESILEAIKCEKKIIVTKKEINLDDYSIPDYGDLDLSLYKNLDSLSLEFSRGCTGQCTFCNEKNFWRYKNKSAEKIIYEIKENIKKYKKRGVIFSDSLINGNMKEFKKFIELLIEEKLQIQWAGSCRINKLMDYELLKKIKETNNKQLNYGIESGSQKILNDMRKGIKIKTIEANLYDGYRAGLETHMTWIIGFPTETNYEALESMTFLFNNRNYIFGMCPGPTYHITHGSDIEKNIEMYGISQEQVWDRFSSQNKRNTILHRFIRLKLTNILLDYFNVNNTQPHTKYIRTQYELKTPNSKPIVDRIEYNECIDFTNYIEDNFRSSIYPEYISFMWLFHKAFGDIKLKFKFNYEEDVAEFSEQLTVPYHADINCDVSVDGTWKLEIRHSSTTEEIFDETKFLYGEFN